MSLIASRLSHMIISRLLLGCNVVFWGSSQISLHNLLRGLFTSAGTREDVGFPYLLWDRKTSQKRHWKLTHETHFMSFTEFLLGIHGADVKNIHLDKAKAVSVISLWVHFSSVSSV